MEYRTLHVIFNYAHEFDPDIIEGDTPEWADWQKTQLSESL